MKRREDAMFELQAGLCKAMANPKRLEILSALRAGERKVNDLVAILGVPKANVSQHLAFMRHKGIVKARKEGASIYYSLASPRILKACSIIKDVLREQMRKRGRLFREAEKSGFFYG